MKVILDDLSAREFFDNGGVVNLKPTKPIKMVNNVKEISFNDCDEYFRFLRSLYLINDNDIEMVNDSINIKAQIGNKYYSINHSRSSSIEMCKFYIDGIYAINYDLPDKDCWGVKNVNFSRCNKRDTCWTTYQAQRIKNGFDETEVWDLGFTIVAFIIPRLKLYIDLLKKHNPQKSHDELEDLDEIYNKLCEYKAGDIDDIGDTFNKLSSHIDTLWI